VLRAAERLRCPAGLRIRGENVTISTVGLLPELRELASLDVPYRVVLSLHSAFSEKRASLVPTGRRFADALVRIVVASRRSHGHASCSVEGERDGVPGPSIERTPFVGKGPTAARCHHGRRGAGTGDGETPCGKREDESVFNRAPRPYRHEDDASHADEMLRPITTPHTTRGRVRDKHSKMTQHRRTPARHLAPSAGRTRRRCMLARISMARRSR
jgi:hypothetical protein